MFWKYAFEILYTALQLLFLFGWWLVGHMIYMGFVGCKEGFGACRIIEPIGIIFIFVGNVFLLRITRTILDVMYKRELPGGVELSKALKQAMANEQKGKKKK